MTGPKVALLSEVYCVYVKMFQTLKCTEKYTSA